MFDFAKNNADNMDVYIHPIPGYSNPSGPSKLKIIITSVIALVAIAAIAYTLVDLFGDSDNNQTSTEQTAASDINTTVTPEIPAVFEPPEPPVIDKQDKIVSQIQPVETVTPETETTSTVAAPEAIDTESFTPKKVEKPVRKNVWLEEVVKEGDTLSHIFERFELSSTLLLRITHSSEEAASLATIRPGQRLRAYIGEDGKFKKLIWIRNSIESMIIEETEDGFEFKKTKKKVETRQSHATGSITSSLFLDGQKAGLSDKVIMEMAEIFGWDIDFALGLRKGDRFTIIHEEHYLDGEKHGDGAILAAEFVNRGNRYRAIRFKDPSGEVGYYTPAGKGMRKAFLKSPVKFSRISSRFNPKRWHPVLKKWRSHKGVDYAAPTGTPIRATASGKITFSGWKGGYGRVVFIEHRNKYTTVYGHMSGFAKIAKTGKLIKQGQVIGYVGKSGMATGPHLHYEMRVKGVHKDPLKVKFPTARPIPPKYYLEFMDYSNGLIAQLALISNRKVADIEKKKLATLAASF